MTTCHNIRTIIENMQERKQELQFAIAHVVKKYRKKSITKSADEIGMGKSLWADLENGIKDPQLSTIWRIAEGLEIKPSELIRLTEEYLGDGFSFWRILLLNRNKKLQLFAVNYSFNTG